MNAHVLPDNLPEPAVAYIDSMPPGHVEMFSLTSLDVTNIACWNTIFLNDDGRPFSGETPHGVGYGSTDQDAMIGATGELAEAVHSAAGFSRMKLTAASYNMLFAKVGQRGVADPLTLCLPAGSPVDHETLLDWVGAKRWPSGDTVFVPAELAACAPGDLRPGYTPFTTPITNGLGAGPTLEFAIAHGIGELLQRDGNGLGFRAMDRGITLDLGDGPADPRTRALLQQFATAGIEVMPKFASDEFGVANLYVVGRQIFGQPAFPIMVTACGEAASLDREHALRKALLEFASSRMRKAFSHAPLDRIAHVAPPGYLQRFRIYHTLAEEESRALAAMKKWCQSDIQTLTTLLDDNVFSSKASVPFETLPCWTGDTDGLSQLTKLTNRLGDAGMEVLFLDFSPPGFSSVHVVKAIVPGLEVETMSYHRIGERGVRKLLDRASHLVGFSEAPVGAKRVCLPSGAAARLGGEPWLDVVEIDRIVGELYPLYREPLVHSTPIAMETKA